MAVPPPPLSPAARDLLGGLLSDATTMAADGVATRHDIDAAMRLGAGHPRGPFELLDGVAPAVPHTAAAIAAVTAWSPVGVAGSGHMAAGIVESVARSGTPVYALVRSEDSAERLMRAVRRSTSRAVERGRLSRADADAALDRITITQHAPDLAATQIVIEAVAENLAIKSTVLRSLDQALPAAVVLATNTSSFRVADLRPHVTEHRPLLALHFFNPAPAMRLIEIVVPADAADRTALLDQARAWAASIHKTAVTCADRRGFVVNRLLIPFLNDAVRRHDDGTPAAEIDQIMIDGAEHPMGPLALIDLIGLDVTIAALRSMAEAETSPQARDRLLPAATLHRLAAAGHLGRKTGNGFHTYS
jgi:3-hydroxybutyryl-CoA dehydrogenase